MGFPVDGKVVEQVELMRWKTWPWRLDIWPFAILYAAWLVVILPSIDLADAAITLGAFGILHVLTWLFTYWSVNFRCFVQANQVKDVREANICKVIPAKFSGTKEIVPVCCRKVLAGASSSLTTDVEEFSFEFRKQRFIFSEEKQCFCKLPYPSKETIGFYIRNTGYGSDAKVNAAMEKWGRNVFEFPQPTFQKLMKEHCMEPFFVFQVFCVCLWCLDEYWYYSLFTLFMLFLFESTMAKSRLKTLTELRRVRVDNQTLMVHRGGKWVKLSGMDLLPGDVVSIGRLAGQNGEDRTIPADMLLLSGSVITNEAILTGESTPQWKVSIQGRELGERLSARRDKGHVLFGGTKILQHTSDKSPHLKTPDGGCLAIILRTGFETSQGKLMRTILFSTERVTANSWESGLFILFLVVFALIAAGYVLKKGLEDPTRSKYKLFLSCSLIITSVIPPELPMELSIAVNTSLIALARRGIFCTEPFRIPFAGKVDICCFDKTGTLTTDDMEFRGFVGLDGSQDLETDTSKVPGRTLEVLAASHALVFVDNKLVGDPLEKAALKGIDWIYTSDEKAMPRKGNGQPVQILQRHHFASHLKRMAVVARVQDEFFAFVKGAPETIQERLLITPPGYVDTYKHYTRQGSRVLALAYKHLPEMPVGEARSLERETVESELTFAGFVVFNCPVRSDSADVLRELKASSHDLVMITGDQALTACHVAGQVHIVSQPSLILTPMKNNDGFEWISPDEMVKIPYRENEVEDLSVSHDLCIGGDCFMMLQRTNALLLVIPYVKVFARVAPEQKELILTTLKMVGRMTLMCGDGTNDVGALKQAHVGVALLNAIPPTQSSESSTSAQPLTSGAKTSKSRKPKSGVSDPAGQSLSVNPIDDGPAGAVPTNRSARSNALTAVSQSHGSSSNRHLNSAERQRQKLKKIMDEMGEEGDGRTAPIVRLGDASMASPFTAKHASVRPITDIIRQGRSTLVTTLQMFKILGLNCLATAYVLSVMYLDGVKLGDMQATISGIFTAAFFLFISHARPLDKLSAQRPHPNIFCSYVFLSLLGQFAIHLTFLISTVKEAEKYMPEECIEPDSEFHPNLVNTVSYMANMMIQVATFAVNYMGHPFNQSIRENKPFLYALAMAVVFFTAITSDMFRSLNDWLKLVPLPQPFGSKILLWAFLMMISCFLWEHTLRWLFPGRMPSWKRRQRQMSSSQKKFA
ncbi:probable manganese-transporting ATPase PDR2 [Cryptomeria japonica]|uniref:probable manganese-transporting ATPase PDR2 n=1 Tax=Cryptomeria japonica TaxID=3369 RepID=UPI0025ACD2EF|nr:probable manganese-transporting ATPase PDR2 [Cryptomeria japonica]XP_057826972.1 probable manganese-transporting ATPase PDR2 [Cryptomeria japonica]